MNKLILPIVAFFLFFTAMVSAQETNCPVVYGGGLLCNQNTEVSIDKKVLDPISGNYVDNLTSNLESNSTVDYQITVTNNTDKDVKNLKLTDSFSNKIEFIKSDTESDHKNNVVTLTIDTLTKSETKTISYQVKTPKDYTSTSCLYNTVGVTINKQTAKDTVSICFDSNTVSTTTQVNTNTDTTSMTSDQNMVQNNTSKQPSIIENPNQTKGGKDIYTVTNVNKSPNTGPGLISLITLLSAGISGLYIRNRIS